MEAYTEIVTERLNITQIFKDYSSRLKRFIRNSVKSAEDAEDILQDVYYQLLEAERVSKPIELLTSWLYTVTRNKITDFYRKKSRDVMHYVSTPEIKDDEEEEEYLNEIREIIFDNGSTPETEYLRNLIMEEIGKALEELPEEQKKVFEMNEMEGISFKEISEQTGETVNTLISRKRYAVLHLRYRLQRLYNDMNQD